jgi:hypothetical protein
VAITLGKDCEITVGDAIVSARSVTLDYSVRTIDVEPFGSRVDAVYPVAYTGTVTVEFNDSADLAGIYDAIVEGSEITVTGGAGDWEFPAVVTRASESDPIDGVATFSLEARMTLQNLRG